MATDTVPRQKWWKIQWYSDGQYSSCSPFHVVYFVSEAHRVAALYDSRVILIYEIDDTPEERRFIIKLDLIVVPYAVLAYWVKYIGLTPSIPC